MKKEYFINPNYTISIIEVAQEQEQEKSNENLVKTLNCKYMPESESDKINHIVEIKSEDTSNNLQIKDADSSDFETAMKATEFGKFNCLILFTAFWGYMSCMYVTTSMSLVLPSAECDLNLSSLDKGILNSAVYTGMIISAFFWGLISDSVGRKNVLMASFALNAFFEILVGLAQNFPFLLVAKLFSGFTSCAALAILASFLAENHAKTYRSSVILCSGFFTSTGAFTLPILAWLIIPLRIRLVLFNGYIILPSWRIFLIVTSIPAVMAFILLNFLDESPKFLMFKGRNQDALKVFKKIYAMNTGRSKHTFPIKILSNETGKGQSEIRDRNATLKQLMNTGWKQMIPIFQRPYLTMAFLPCIMQFFTLLSTNTIRLWSPQLFSLAIEKEKYSYNTTVPSSVCELLVHVSRSTEIIEDIVQCSENVVSEKVYFNAMITGVVTAIGYLISSYIVKSIEKKWLMIISYSLSVACCFGLYWSTTSNYLLGVISVFLAVTSTSATAIIGVVIDIFPTSLRTTAVSLCLTFGRLGAMGGNIVFPLLLDIHCTAPFILLAIFLLIAAGLALFIPKTRGKKLE